MLVFAQCKSDMVKIPYSKATIEKTSLGYIVVVGDFFIILVFISFTNILEKSQKSYVKKFYNDTLEMTDFTIRIKPMPHDGKYGDRDSLLKAYLTAHFESIVRDKYAETQIQMRGSGDFE